MLSTTTTTRTWCTPGASSSDTARTPRPRRFVTTGPVSAGRGIVADVAIEPSTNGVDIPNTGAPRLAKQAAPPRGELR